MTAGPVEGDLAKRSAEVFSSAGLPWAKAALAGRDAVVSGEAPSPESQKLAIAAAERAWGVRRVADSTTVSADIKPYVTTATREGGKITLTGHVPSDTARAAIVNAAKAAFPNAQIEDKLQFGRGAGAAYVPALAHGLGQLGKLTGGVVTLSDNALSVVGQAVDFAGRDQVLAALKQLPQGASLAKAEIGAPRMSPYLFSATKAADGITLAGYVPSEAARAAAVAAAAAAKGVKVVDNLRIADGLPSGLDLSKASEFMFAQLGSLKTGAASLRDDALSLTGQTDELSAFEAVTGVLKNALPGGMKLAAQDIKGPAPVSPYVWSATKAGNTVTLAGSIPSETLRAPILDTAKKTFPGDAIVDQMKLGLGAPNGFANAVSAALGQLGRLSAGVATLTNTALKVTGDAANRAIADQVRTGLSGSGLPAGFAAETQISFKEPPPPPPPAPVVPPPPAPVVPPAPAPLAMPTLPPQADLVPIPKAPVVVAPAPSAAEICQVKFREILGKDAIHFATASARITRESQGVIRVLADAVKACPSMSVEIQGHTDADGNDEMNMELSQARAQAVVEALHALGVGQERMTAKGYGKTRPIAANDTPESKAKNRRIEFIVSK